MTTTELLFCFGAAAVVSAAAQPLLIAWAARQRIVAVPNERSSHTRDTPVGGGLPITLAIIAALAWLGSTGVAGDWWMALAAGTALVAAVSWLDDVRGVGAVPRLIVQTAAAAWAATALGFGVDAGGAPALALAVVWLVGLTNIYNFMDGIDGIAGAQAAVSGLAWAGVGLMAGSPAATALGVVIAGAALGFLPFNWQPARIFMGDVGAAPVGFVFAALALIVIDEGWRHAVAGVLSLWPFLFDSAFTLGRRLVAGENVFRAHRTHLYQRLVRAGWSHRRTTSVYAGAAVAGGASGGAALATGGAAWALAATAVAGLGLLLWAGTARAETRTGARAGGARGR